MFLSILAQTPVWTWMILAYLIVIGMRATRKRIIYLPNLFIIPTILITSRLIKITQPGKLAIGLITGMIIGFTLHNTSKVKILKERLSVELPGSYNILILLLSCFFLKYVFGILRGMNIDWAFHFEWFEIMTSGILSGYFLGRAIRYVTLFIRTKP